MDSLLLYAPAPEYISKNEESTCLQVAIFLWIKSKLHCVNQLFICVWLTYLFKDTFPSFLVFFSITVGSRIIEKGKYKDDLCEIVWRSSNCFIDS